MELESVSTVAQIESDIASLSFQGNDGTYVIVSRSLRPSSQDKKLGHDKVHVEVNDQISSTYGGLIGATLTSRYLRLVLNDRSSGNVGAIAITVNFRTEPLLWNQIRRVADTVFEYEKNYRVEA